MTDQGIHCKRILYSVLYKNTRSSHFLHLFYVSVARTWNFKIWSSRLLRNLPACLHLSSNTAKDQLTSGVVRKGFISISVFFLICLYFLFIAGFLYFFSFFFCSRLTVCTAYTCIHFHTSKQANTYTQLNMNRRKDTAKFLQAYTTNRPNQCIRIHAKISKRADKTHTRRVLQEATKPRRRDYLFSLAGDLRKKEKKSENSTVTVACIMPPDLAFTVDSSVVTVTKARRFNCVESNHVWRRVLLMGSRQSEQNKEELTHRFQNLQDNPNFLARHVVLPPAAFCTELRFVSQSFPRKSLS